MINRQDPIFIQWNIDSNNNKISIAITNEQHQITNAQFTLVQLPDYNKKVRFPDDSSMYEIDLSQQITNNKQFKVDYNTGIVYAHPDLEASVVSVNYSGKGVIKYPATRIYDVLDNVPIDSAKSLQDYINKIKEYEFEDFDPIKVYNPNKIVYWNGSTYVCIQQTLNHETPSNTLFWRTMTAGFHYRENYNNETPYLARDMVFYEPEQTIYLCVKNSTGNLPTNTEFWIPTVSVKGAATYATQQGDYAKGQGDYAKAQGDYTKTERESIIAEYAILKNDFLNATHVEMITVMNDEFVATQDNTSGFELSLTTYNPLIDILQLAYKGVPLYEGDQYVLTGMTVSFLGFTLNSGEKIKIRVEKAVRDTPPVGADGSDIMNGSIGELKLAADVQVKLNRMVVIQDYTFTATQDNTTTFIIASDIFNSITDVLDIYRENLKLTKDTNYSLVGQEVTLFEGLNTNEFVEYRITKNTGNSLPLMPDGSLIQNGTVSIQKLTQEAQNIINTIGATEIEVQNARNGETTLKAKIDKLEEEDIALQNQVDTTISYLYDITPSLKSMGAVLDGITNDAPIINTYINNLPTSGKTRVIVLPDRTIGISKIVINTPNVILRGGNNTVLKKITGSPLAEDFISVQADNVTVENISFDDNSIKGGYLVNANYLQTTPIKNIKIRDLKFTAKDVNSRGIMVGYSNGAEVSGCILENTVGTPDSYSFGITIWSQKDLGDNTMMTKNIFVHHNRVKGFFVGINSWGTGTGVSGNRQRMIVEGNIVEKCVNNGINCYHSPRSVIANNFVRNCGSIGIWSDAGADYEYDYSDSTDGFGNRVIANFVQACTCGILTEEFRFGCINSNIVIQCSNYGIGLGGGTDSSTISNNTVRENGVGIRVDKNINPNGYYIFDLEFNGNIVKRNNKHGIKIGGTKKTIKINGGSITDNGYVNKGVGSPSTLYAGIWIGKDNDTETGAASSRVVISNVALSNGYDCVGDGSDGLTPSGAQSYGVYCQTSGIAGVSIQSCEFYGHTTNHIYATWVTNGGVIVKDCFFMTTNVSSNLSSSKVYLSGNINQLTDYSNDNVNFSMNGAWNTDHLMLGNYHIWVDSGTGKLYIKGSTPTSATDGTVIGSQV